MADHADQPPYSGHYGSLVLAAATVTAIVGWRLQRAGALAKIHVNSAASVGPLLVLYAEQSGNLSRAMARVKHLVVDGAQVGGCSLLCVSSFKLRFTTWRPSQLRELHAASRSAMLCSLPPPEAKHHGRQHGPARPSTMSCKASHPAGV